MKVQEPPAKVPLVTKSQFTPLVKPVNNSQYRPPSTTSSNFKLASTGAGIPAPVSKLEESEPPLPPPVFNDFPAPPPEFTSPVKSKPTGSSTGFGTPDILDRPSVLAPRNEIEKSTQNFSKITPIIPRSNNVSTPVTKPVTTPVSKPVSASHPVSKPVSVSHSVSSSSNLPPKAPSKIVQPQQPKPVALTETFKLNIDTNDLETQINDMKLANDPARRRGRLIFYMINTVVKIYPIRIISVR